jgi:hypothetical protein
MPSLLHYSHYLVTASHKNGQSISQFWALSGVRIGNIEFFGAMIIGFSTPQNAMFGFSVSRPTVPLSALSGVPWSSLVPASAGIVSRSIVVDRS